MSCKWNDETVVIFLEILFPVNICHFRKRNKAVAWSTGFYVLEIISLKKVKRKKKKKVENWNSDQVVSNAVLLPLGNRARDLSDFKVW